MTIEEFIEARLAEDEATALAAAPRTWRPEVWQNKSEREFLVVADACVGAPSFAISDEKNAEHIARHDPARVLREAGAKRRILDEYRGEVDRGPAGDRADFVARHGGILDAYRVCLRALASGWSDHPDFDPSWAVDAGGSNP